MADAWPPAPSVPSTKTLMSLSSKNDNVSSSKTGTCGASSIEWDESSVFDSARVDPWIALFWPYRGHMWVDAARPLRCLGQRPSIALRTSVGIVLVFTTACWEEQNLKALPSPFRPPTHNPTISIISSDFPAVISLWCWFVMGLHPSSLCSLRDSSSIQCCPDRAPE